MYEILSKIPGFMGSSRTPLILIRSVFTRVRHRVSLFFSLKFKLRVSHPREIPLSRGITEGKHVIRAISRLIQLAHLVPAYRC